MIAPGEIEFRDISIPAVKDDDVLIKMKRIGICGSDIHVYHGAHPYTFYPVTQGHEASGRVEKIGKNITHLNAGDKVTIQPQVICGKCYPCTHGKYHICDNLKVMGFQIPGMASEYFMCEAERVIKLPDDMSYEEGAMIEPVAVACGALSKVKAIRGLNIAVLGAGPIGNLMAQVAKALGAQSVLITDLSDMRLDIAKEVGIDVTVNPARQNFVEEVAKAFGPAKADLTIECVGANSTIDAAIESARKGTDIILVGVFGEKPTVDLGVVQDHELRLIGTLMYQTQDYLKAIDLVSSKKVNLAPLMARHFAFEDYKEAYDYIDREKNKVMKAFIDIS